MVHRCESLRGDEIDNSSHAQGISEDLQAVVRETTNTVQSFLPDSPPSGYHTPENKEPPTTNPIALLFKDSTPP